MGHLLKRSRQTLRLAFLFVLGVLVPLPVLSAGLVVNELSNGTSGSREFFEFLVVGDAINPVGAVDLNGWIFDDQNGDWSGAGIAPGFMRFNSIAVGCTGLQSIPVSSLVLVYNNDSAAIPSSTKNLAITAVDDLDDTNPADGVYIIPNTSACVEGYNSPPYAGAMGATSWSRVALRNGGDAGQARDPSGALFHGLSFGDVGDTTVPANGIDIIDGGASGAGRNYFLSCGSWNDALNFSTGNAASQDTPGWQNDSDNRLLIDRIASGVFDYANLANTENCAALPLPPPQQVPLLSLAWLLSLVLFLSLVAVRALAGVQKQ